MNNSIDRIMVRMREITERFGLKPEPAAPAGAAAAAPAAEPAADGFARALAEAGGNVAPAAGGADTRARIERAVAAEAQRNGLAPELLRAVIEAESGGDPQAQSPAGAMGLMQLMPGTAAELGVAEPYDIEQNIAGGARYLGRMLNQFGDTRQALAAYNGRGPGHSGNAELRGENNATTGCARMSPQPKSAKGGSKNKKEVRWALAALLAALVSMVLVFDRIGLIDARALAMPYLAQVPYVRDWVLPPPLATDALLAEERANQIEALELANGLQQDSAAELTTRAAELQRQEESIRTQQELLAQRQDELRQQGEQREAEEARYKKMVELFSNMQPQAAARILAATDTVTGEPQIEDETVMAVLNRMESSMASIILQNMPTDRASALMRKMGH